MAVRAGTQFEERYPEGSRSATECAMNLVQAGDLIVGRVAAILRSFDLTPAGGLVLSILADAQAPLAPHEIGERLIVTRATVTGLLDSLERRGSVRRTAHPQDRRMLLVELTPEGRRVASRFRPVVHRRQKEWFEGVSEAERVTLLRLLGRIQDRLASLPPEGATRSPAAATRRSGAVSRSGRR